MSDETQAEGNDGPQPHPDEILSDTERIINNASAMADAEAMMDAFRPMGVTAIWMFNMFLGQGISKQTAEEMILILWYRLFNHGYGGVHEFGDGDDD